MTHVVITGASRGVGRALADLYRARGARVTGTSRRGSPEGVLPGSPAQDGPAQDGPAQDGPAQDGPAQDGPAQDGTAQDASPEPVAPVLLPLDLTDPAAPAALAERLGADPIDLLVCNAGMFADRHDTVAGGYPAPLWAEEFQVNVTGAFLTVQALLPQLRAGKGRIALISSQMASDAAPGGNALIYRATKAALLNLGRNLAVALEGDGIAVGIYHPGWVRTDMGGAGAAISASESAEGLAARFDALSPETSGAFLTWDGRPHAH